MSEKAKKEAAVLKRVVVIIMLYGAFFLFISTVCMEVSSAAPDRAIEKHILILSPYTPDFPASASSTRGMKSKFQQYSQYKFSYSYEYFNLARFAKTQGYIEDAFQHIQRKYSNNRPDLIVSELEALNVFLAKYGHELFPGVPVISQQGLIGEEAEKTLQKPRSSDWFREEADKNISLILQTRPQTKNIYIITGNSELEQRILHQISLSAKQYENKVNIIFLNKLTYDRLLEWVKNIDENSTILYIQWTVDLARQNFISAQVLQSICSESKAPVYSIAAHYLGTGIVGGYAKNWEKTGQLIAEQGINILEGKKLTNHPLDNTQTNEYVFDWRQLKRWGINENSLPHGSKIEHREHSIWDLYKWQILGVSMVVFLEAMLIVILLVNRTRKLKAEAEIRQLNLELENIVHERTQELIQLNRQLELTARTDGLTGLSNRRYMSERIEEEFARFVRHGKPFSLVIADIDWFKTINDTYGHQVGDCVLKFIADELRESFRAFDLVARWGGEEFLFLFPETGLEQAAVLSERLRKKIAEKIYCCGEIELNVAMTFGVASVQLGDVVDNVMKRADDALYEGKHAGRNRVVIK